MLVCGIIAEYNPYHLGHSYHIEQAKALSGATHTVAVMSGDFVQRGQPAVCDRFVRAEMAVRSGVDLVLELPLPWAVSTAQRFAMGGVSLLHQLGVVSHIAFGSECGDTDALCRLSQLIDRPEVTALTAQRLADGITYAAARQAAVEQLCPTLAPLLANPNDTLGTEYIRALNAFESTIKPLAIKRLGAVHDGPPSGSTASASYIREHLHCARRFMPESAAYLLEQAVSEGNYVADAKQLSLLILSRLRDMTYEQIAALPDVSEGLERRILSVARDCTDPSALIDLIKCKRYTHARLRRICLSALLGLTEQMACGNPPYIRVLAMNGRGAEILGAAKHCKLPIITRSRDSYKLTQSAKAVFEAECRASDIYGLLCKQIKPCGHYLTHGIITI